MEDIRDVEDTRRQIGGVKRATLGRYACRCVRWYAHFAIALCVHGSSTVCGCRQYLEDI